MRTVVTGGAGFIGSHLCEALINAGHTVVAVDNLVTGRLENLAELARESRFSLEESDVIGGLQISGEVDAVFHLASPASPDAYAAYPIETLRVGSEGTRHALELASACGARFLLASTSEVYGDPEIHPQPETYAGNVDPVGPRPVYDEAKRYAEALTATYRRLGRADTRIVRIFNTYGPRMRLVGTPKLTCHPLGGCVPVSAPSNPCSIKIQLRIRGRTHGAPPCDAGTLILE